MTARRRGDDSADRAANQIDHAALLEAADMDVAALLAELNTRKGYQPVTNYAGCAGP